MKTSATGFCRGRSLAGALSSGTSRHAPKAGAKRFVVNSAAANGASGKGFAANRVRYPAADQLQAAYTAAQIADRYGFPHVTKETNRWVAIIELSLPLGTGFDPQDTKSFCSQLGIDVPHFEELNVRGASNIFSTSGLNTNQNGCVEYALDIQVVTGASLGSVKLLLVNAPNDSGGIADALEAVYNYTLPAGEELSAVTLSWGADEDNYSPQERAGIDKWLEALQQKNIPTFVSSDDQGGMGQGSGVNVDYPASSPFSVGCGGTFITHNNIITEVAWEGSGGGISVESALANDKYVPANGKRMRCVPDVAGDASPQSGYTIICAGQQQIVGGTSAVAPLWAAWKALTDAVAGATLPFKPETAYQAPRPSQLTDIVLGTNHPYYAGPGYDLVTGLGVPNRAFTDWWLKRNGAGPAPSGNGAGVAAKTPVATQ